MSQSKDLQDPRAPRPPSAPLQESRQPAPGQESRMRNKPDHGEATYRGLGRMIGRVALITGGDSGIGRAICIAFAREGADVAVAYLEEDADAQETERWVTQAGSRCLLLRGDIGDPGRCKEAVRQTIETFGRIDVLVNNAAYQGEAAGGLEALDSERLERTFRTNVIATINLAREALRYIPAGGAIINTASIQAYKPSPPIMDYAATKGAIVTLTKGLSQELIQRGIRVNCVAPGPVWTPLIVQSFKGEKVERFGEEAPIGRVAQPAEVAPAYVFLACDESRYVTGEVLGVTGGMLLS